MFLRSSKYALLLFIFTGCGNPKDIVIPDYVIEREKFILIQKDLALAEALLNANTEKAAGNAFDSLYNFNVLKSHECSRKEYDTTLYFYSQHPALFKEVMEEVLEKLNREKALGEKKGQD